MQEKLNHFNLELIEASSSTKIYSAANIGNVSTTVGNSVNYSQLLTSAKGYKREIR